ncbi:hypothetical protein EB74_33610 [Mycobacterium sp. SWH-M5]|nr:hypothetical protein EB74_33610 [Mycobacterium sp. SWH-M5]
MGHPIQTGPDTGHPYVPGYQPAQEGLGYQPAHGGWAYQPALDGSPQQPLPPGHFTAPASAAKRRGPGLLIAVLVGVSLMSAGIGAAVGTIAANLSTSNDRAAQTVQPADGSGAVNTGDTHAQDVGLCTRYAIINSAIPKPYDNAMDILPAAAALQTSMADYPGASEAVRQAISDVVSAYYARMAVFGDVRERGLADPPPDDKQAAQAAYDKAWEVCGLDAG